MDGCIAAVGTATGTGAGTEGGTGMGAGAEGGTGAGTGTGTVTGTGTKSTIQMATFVVYYTCLQCERLFELVNWEQTCFAYPIWLLVYHHECVRPGKAS